MEGEIPFKNGSFWGTHILRTSVYDCCHAYNTL